MIAIHQSQFLPWIPYFFKICKSDIFVILDDVQYQKNGVQNRNRIKTPNGPKWLTVPVKRKLGDKINEVEISKGKIFDKILRTIEMNYKKSFFYNEISKFLKIAVVHKHEYLADFNKELLVNILKIIGIGTDIIFSSSIQTSNVKDDLVIEIIKHFGEKEYFSGQGAMNYMVLNKFKKENIRMLTYDFNHSEYPQLWNKQQGFIPNLSIIDLLFNDLENAGNYIVENGKVKLIQ